jgi:hydroxymethylpyrimidine pyrophosphatase-like HAD family hydrolase
MHYQILATDYDGTLAHHGRVDALTIAALDRLVASGRRLVMVTGRELPELKQVFPQLDRFEWVVAENGALLYRPSTGEEKPLAEPPPERFINTLTLRGVAPMSVGRVIVATWEPHEKTVLETIHHLALERQVIFNKGAVMILPTGVNKATGLTAALAEMQVAPELVVGVGDAENDHAFLKYSGLGAAVANALPAVKETADITLLHDHGAGVVELIDRLIDNDLADVQTRTARRRHKLAQGELSPECSFYFRGPDSKLNLRAQNLTLFLQLAEGVDDATWEYHLRRGDYSRWFRQALKDELLAHDAAEVESQNHAPPRKSRDHIRRLIEREYDLTAPKN